MRRARACVAVSVVLAALIPHLACEKETHRAARKAFQDILASNLPPVDQANALEEFVRAYPEPKTNPNLVRACGMLAEFHIRAGRPDIAASWYERAVRASPGEPLRWALADWLLYRRISGRELARRAGLSRSTIHRLTSGHGQRVDLRTLARVCRVLDLTPGEIIVWQHDDPLPPGGRGRARQLRLPGRGWR
jgi:putative transcriptional regulator